MNGSIERVLDYLTGKDNIGAVDLDELKNDVAESPYFAVSQILLTKKMAETQEAGYEVQLSKSALYVPNPLWLQHLLTAAPISEFAEADLLETAGLPSSTPALTSTAPANASVVAPDAGGTVDLSVNASEQFPETSNGANEPHLSHNENDLRIGSEEVRSTIPSTFGEQADQEMAILARDTNPAVETFIDHLQPSPGEESSEVSTVANISNTAETAVIQFDEEMAGVTRGQGTTIQGFLDELEEPKKPFEQVQEDEHDRMFQNIKAMLDATSEEAEADTTAAVVPIDPYYTIDYFASQGIKLELDKYPQDQLGQSLKKFTHWLKHMKKLGPEDAAEVISRTETEVDIQQIADSSNTVREVVTEAMATVLEKQGKNEKAIELYNKLSFLNPDKSVYFAQKVQKLKGH